MSLTARAVLELSATLTSTTDLTAPKDTLALVDTLASLSHGTLINQASKIWTDRRTLLTETGESLDIVTPAARDSLGQSLAFSKIKLLYIKNRSTTPGDVLQIGGENSVAAWVSAILDQASVLELQPGGTLVLVAPSEAGYPCVTSTNHLLLINNPGANSIDYDIVLIGA